MKFIVVQTRPEDSIYGSAMYIIASSHDRFNVGDRFDYGFMGISVEEGFLMKTLLIVIKTLFSCLYGNGSNKLY